MINTHVKDVRGSLPYLCTRVRPREGKEKPALQPASAGKLRLARQSVSPAGFRDREATGPVGGSHSHCESARLSQRTCGRAYPFLMALKPMLGHIWPKPLSQSPFPFFRCPPPKNSEKNLFTGSAGRKGRRGFREKKRGRPQQPSREGRRATFLPIPLPRVRLYLNSLYFISAAAKRGNSLPLGK